MQPDLFSANRSVLDVRTPAQRRSKTSLRAAEKLTASGCRGAQMAKLLGAYAAVGVPGLTMSEIEVRAGLRISSICSLRASAVRQGWVLPLAETRVARDTHHEQSTHRITTNGLQALSAWQERRR